jgi:flagellar hook-associated protein 1
MVVIDPDRTEKTQRRIPMSGLFPVLQMGGGALNAQQMALQATGQNITNANTPGYSRQRVSLCAAAPNQVDGHQVGAGVTVASVDRIVDKFLNEQLAVETGTLAFLEARKESLDRLEAAFADTEEYGLSGTLSAFWNAWQELSNDPGSDVTRTQLLSAGEDLSSTFNRISTDLDRIASDIDRGLLGTVDEINELARRIADLNVKIARSESGGASSNDYRDSRDSLVNEMATMMDISTFESENGMLAIMVGNGNMLVNREAHYRVSAVPDGAGFHDLAVEDGAGEERPFSDSVTSGRIGALIALRDSDIADYADRLDQLAGSLIQAVNDVHGKGYGIRLEADGNYVTGIDFFSGTSAGDMALSREVGADNRLIAAATEQGAVPGDNRNASAIAALQNESFTIGDQAAVRFSDFYASLLSGLGSESRQASSAVEHGKSVVSQLGAFRESVSGVSLDEEMVNLMVFRHSYEAAARMVRTMDELIQSILSMV